MSSKTVRKTVIVKHEIETRVVVDITAETLENNTEFKLDNVPRSTFNNIVRVAHHKMRESTNNDASYPHMENITSISLDEDKV